jgi:hypothetical protein
MSYQKVTLSRRQIERLAVFLSLQSRIEHVTIEETNESGIGANHSAVYHTAQIEREFGEDITDVGNW